MLQQFHYPNNIVLNAKKIKNIDYKDLNTFKTKHPFSNLIGSNKFWNYEVPIISSSIVTEETGTGFVHMAPSHGAEDFEEFLKRGWLEELTHNVNEDSSFVEKMPIFGGLEIFNKKGKERYIEDFNPEKTLLGKNQWKWLKDKLIVESDIKIIISSLQILSLGHGWESWDKFPLEREKFLKLIDESNISNLFILSGDRHRGGFYQFKTVGNNNIYEFTSSSLNLPIPFNTEEKGPLRIGSTYRKANFGVLRLYEDQVVMELTSDRGKVVNSLTVAIN